MLARRRAFSIDERQRDKMPTVFMPELEQRDFFKINIALPRFEHRSITGCFRAEFRCGKRQIAIFPQLAEFRRKQIFGGMDGATDKIERLFAKGEVDSFAGAEKIGDYGKARAFYIAKKQCLALRVDNPTMYLGDLKIWIDLGIYLDDLVLASKRFDIGAKILMHEDLAHEKHEIHENLSRINLSVFRLFRVFRGQFELLSQIVLAQIEVGGLDDIDLHIRKSLCKIVLKDRIVADDDNITT